MSKFPVDAPKAKVLKALELLGFQVLRQREHIAMIRQNSDGTRTPLTLPNHNRIKASTLRNICTQAGIPREELPNGRRKAVRVTLATRIT
jgi:predicted RNA binding protein YcfA (HicA-like mRNA interferase family)